MKIVKTIIVLSFVIPMLIGCASSGGTPTSDMAEGVVLGDGVVVTADVVGIDKTDRILTLRGPDGDVVALEVSQVARNFDQIEIGDKVRVAYHESVALYIGRHGQKPQASAGLVAARSAKGEKPAGFVVETVDVSAEIKSIDRVRRSVTLQLPDGSLNTTNVDPSIKAFDTLKTGDTVHVRMTEAIAISVEK